MTDPEALADKGNKEDDAELLRSTRDGQNQSFPSQGQSWESVKQHQPISIQSSSDHQRENITPPSHSPWHQEEELHENKEIKPEKEQIYHGQTFNPGKSAQKNFKTSSETHVPISRKSIKMETIKEAVPMKMTNRSNIFTIANENTKTDQWLNNFISEGEYWFNVIFKSRHQLMINTYFRNKFCL